MTATKVAILSNDEKGKSGQDPKNDNKSTQPDKTPGESGHEWIRSSLRKSTSFVIRTGSVARQTLILDSQTAPFLTGLRFCYTLLLITRTLFFILLRDREPEPMSESISGFVLFLDSYLSGSLIPILSLGVCGVIYKRCSLYWIAAVLQQTACLSWYAKAICEPVDHLQVVYFAYDLTLVILSFWLIREHGISEQMKRLSRVGPAMTVRVVRV